MKEIASYYLSVKLPNGTFWKSKVYSTPEAACKNIAKIVAHYDMRYTAITVVKDVKREKVEQA